MISRIVRDLLRPTVWVTAERVFTEVFSLTLFAVQARLLGPTAFGLIAAVMVFVSFWDAVPMNAVLEALVSVPQIEERHFTTGATATVLVSLIFGAAVFGCAGPMAELFGDAEMGSVMRALAVLPVLQAFSIVPLAIVSWSLGRKGCPRRWDAPIRAAARNGARGDWPSRDGGWKARRHLGRLPASLERLMS